MYDSRRNIFWFAIITRIIVLSLQFIFNILCPDHYADAFRSPIDHSERISLYDNIITYLFSGLAKWDGEYFLHIAKYGYTYENTLAFYPLYPMLIRVTAIFIRTIFFVLNIHSSVLIAAVLINIICFVKSAVVFYDLSKVVLKASVAYKAAILYCINPATIFFSAIYSESLFAYLTYYSMLKSIKLDPYVFFPIGLSILTRSNGIVNVGFPVYFELRKLFYTYTEKDANFSLKALYQFIFKITSLKSFCLIFSTIITSIVPLLLLQMYNYIIFCIPNLNQTFIFNHIANSSIINNLVLPGSDNIEWCHLKIPVAYSYIQKKYWNVGFMNYYKIKQIPNFVLAFPILYIMIRCIKEYFFEHKKYFYTLGFIKDIEHNVQTERKKYPIEMLVFVLHGLFLTVFCILFVHIQVSTRLISSASPLIYWYCALSMSDIFYNDDNSIDNNKENIFWKWKVFFLTMKRYTLKNKLIFSYFLGYAVVGCFMFPNFLPWT
ncbi:PREDICTED: GPI mannosyltransferase 2 [Eufriesea mexicana]|uniref:GPI mannosyltransferase 2 n=1 Tax=Eufriesea mexicana TaxID=516756 RepID=UPI00083C2F83|nr:PREDICTED: GPI mannosyltransferase 2 [Eufriesea mexicana]